MTIEQQVNDASSPKEALLVIARALDQMVPAPTPANPWEWNAVSKAVASLGERRTEVTSTEDSAEVELPPVSAEKQTRRAHFEKHFLKLHEYLGDSEDWNRHYQLGGPMWIYLGNRDLVMTLPDQIKQALVEDVLEDSPQDAQEMGRDILKRACETGPGGVGMRIAEGDIG